MYAAVIRFVHGTSAECDLYLKSEHERLRGHGVIDTGDFTSHDGTIQLSVEDLSPDKFQFTGDMIKAILSGYDSLGDITYNAEEIARSLNQGIDTAFNQGVLSAVKGKVTFPFKE